LTVTRAVRENHARWYTSLAAHGIAAEKIVRLGLDDPRLTAEDRAALLRVFGRREVTSE
jgi:hypothetical protein